MISLEYSRNSIIFYTITSFIANFVANIVQIETVIFFQFSFGQNAVPISFIANFIFRTSARVQTIYAVFSIRAFLFTLKRNNKNNIYNGRSNKIYFTDGSRYINNVSLPVHRNVQVNNGIAR